MADGEPAPALPGYEEPKRMVFCGLYPSDGQDFEQLREALDKLVDQRPQLRLRAGDERRAGLRLPLRLPGPVAHGDRPAAARAGSRHRPGADGAERDLRDRAQRTAKTIEVHTPQDVPDQGEIEEFRQPIVRVNFVLPTEYIGPIMKLCTDRRGAYVRTEYLSPTRAMLVYDLALADVIYDMHDKLKSATRGYGTMDYELLGYRPGDLVRLDILVKGERVDALSIVCDRRDADVRGRAVIKKLKQEIPRHMFEVAAASGDRHADHRPRNDLRDAEERDRQVLRRRHHAASASCGRSRRKARSG